MSAPTLLLYGAFETFGRSESLHVFSYTAGQIVSVIGRSGGVSRTADSSDTNLDRVGSQGLPMGTRMSITAWRARLAAPLVGRVREFAERADVKFIYGGREAAHAPLLALCHEPMALWPLTMEPGINFGAEVRWNKDIDLEDVTPDGQWASTIVEQVGCRACAARALRRGADDGVFRDAVLAAASIESCEALIAEEHDGHVTGPGTVRPRGRVPERRPLRGWIELYGTRVPNDGR